MKGKLLIVLAGVLGAAFCTNAAMARQGGLKVVEALGISERTLYRKLNEYGIS